MAYGQMGEATGWVGAGEGLKHANGGGELPSSPPAAMWGGELSCWHSAAVAPRKKIYTSISRTVTFYFLFFFFMIITIWLLYFHPSFVAVATTTPFLWPSPKWLKTSGFSGCSFSGSVVLRCFFQSTWQTLEMALGAWVQVNNTEWGKECSLAWLPASDL